MPYVFGEPCRDCKYTDCVTVCPMDCFYQDERMLYIDPVECIDCGGCAAQCPVDAIFAESDVPAQWVQYVELNAERAAALKVRPETNITVKQAPLEGTG